MNIQAESGLVDQVDQVDHVKTVTKANMIMLTFLLPARVRAGDSMFDVFQRKPCAGEVWESGNPPHVPASNPAKACESRGVIVI